MSIADELAALHDKLFREERILRSEEDVLARAVEALRAAELLIEAVPPCDEIRDQRWCASHRNKQCNVSELLATLLAMLYPRPSAAPRKPLIGCPDCEWHGGYLMDHCEEHARPSAAVRESACACGRDLSAWDGEVGEVCGEFQPDADNTPWCAWCDHGQECHARPSAAERSEDVEA